MAKYRTCVICGEQFELTQYRGAAITCGPEHAAERSRQRQNSDPYRVRRRLHLRGIRNSNAANFIENRDAEAVKQRARKRWRRGQAARRARLREADAAPPTH